MAKRSLTVALLTVFILSCAGIFAAFAALDTEKPIVPPYEDTKDRASRAMNNMFLGPVETPDNLNQSSTKGTEVDRCIPKTKSGVERGIARVVGGAWQLATFWYSDPGCVTKTSGNKAVTSAAPAVTKGAAATAAKTAANVPSEMK